MGEKPNIKSKFPPPFLRVSSDLSASERQGKKLTYESFDIQSHLKKKAVSQTMGTLL